MASTVDIVLPNQGVATSDWKDLFLSSDGNPRYFINGHSPVAIANNLIVSLLAIATMAAILYLIMAAWSLVTSGGDSEKYTRAKTGIINAVIGIVVLVAMWALIAAIRALATGSIGG